MLIIGLTGSIGSGKSLATKCFKALGIPVHDSDAEVHKLLRENTELIKTIQDRWPTAVEESVVIRSKLGELVFADLSELKTLENMIYPYLHKINRAFLTFHAQMQTPLVVIDMPLLFETGFDQYMDVNVCIVADDSLRLQRVIRRQHMSVEKYKERDGFQMTQDEKKKRADVVLYSGLDKGHMFRQVKALVLSLQGHKGDRWGPRWRSGLKRK